MDQDSIDRIIELTPRLPERIPGIGQEFVEESQAYWETKKEIFYSDKAKTPYYETLSQFRDYQEYLKWYARKAYKPLAELNQSPDQPLKNMIRRLARLYNQTAGEKIITPLPLKTYQDQKLCLILPDDSKIIFET